MPIRIALSGKAGSGKSLTADYLVRKHGFKKLTFAEPIRQILRLLFGIPSKWFTDPVLKESIYEPLGVSTRQLMQKVGTELFRCELHKQLPHLKLPSGSNVWINHIVEQIKIFQDENIVVDDLRFDDEYHSLKDQGFVAFRIRKPGEEKKSDLSDHASEAGCKYDRLIENNGTIDELYRALDLLIAVGKNDPTFEPLKLEIRSKLPTSPAMKASLMRLGSSVIDL